MMLAGSHHHDRRLPNIWNSGKQILPRQLRRLSLGRHPQTTNSWKNTCTVASKPSVFASRYRGDGAHPPSRMIGLRVRSAILRSNRGKWRAERRPFPASAAPAGRTPRPARITVVAAQAFQYNADLIFPRSAAGSRDGFFTTCVAGSFSGTDFCLIFAP